MLVLFISAVVVSSPEIADAEDIMKIYDINFAVVVLRFCKYMLLKPFAAFSSWYPSALHVILAVEASTLATSPASHVYAVFLCLVPAAAACAPSQHEKISPS